ncbi:P-loop containing nucleoside triphosphate hydrolase protein [Rhizophagus irregularis DAOM 181602=DAOM 197198]|nr:P-loop containing nucleoside triphosphate hydrolase protein [Rhizophagus irregularis DAOM 181602=DAOM 197198]
MNWAISKKAVIFVNNAEYLLNLIHVIVEQPGATALGKEGCRRFQYNTIFRCQKIESQWKNLLKDEHVALHGPRASEKTTRVYRTMQQLKEHNCHCFYITLQNVDILTDTDRFWIAIGRSFQISNDIFFNC